MGDKEALSFRSRSAIDHFLQTDSFDPDASPFYYTGWRKINPHIRVERDTPIKNPAYGQQFDVEFTKDKTKVGQMWIKVTRTALTGQGGATFARFQDFEGLAMFERVEILHGEHKVNESNDMHMFLEFNSMEEEDQQAYATHMVFGDLPSATRNTLGSSPQTLFVKLFNPLDQDPRLFMGLQALGEKLLVRLKLRPLNEITETDGNATPTCSITDMRLRTDNYHFADDEKDAHNLRTKGEGLRYRVQEYSPAKRVAVATGVENTEVQYHLQGLTGAASELVFFLYDTANRDYVAPNPVNERYTFEDWDEFRGEMANTRIIPPQEYKWNLHRHQRQWYHGAVGRNMGRWSFSENIEDPIGVWGHQGFSQSHPLDLFIKHSSTAVANTWDLLVFLRRNNWVKHQNSKLMRLVH
jgi:hypothetical protein